LVIDTLTTLTTSTGIPLVGGAVIGLGVGYLLKKIAKLAIIALGAIVLFLKLLEYHKWINVNWATVEDQTQSMMTNATHTLTQVTQQMGHEIPIGMGLVGFLPGMAAGFLKDDG